MAFDYVRAVIQHVPGKPPLRKLVAVVLAQHADRNTGECWPSYRRIAWLAGCNIRAAKDNVRALLADESGFLARVERGGVHTDPDTGRQEHRANVYRLDKTALAAMPQLPDPKDMRVRNVIERSLREARQGAPRHTLKT